MAEAGRGPERREFFYGWTIVGVGFLANVASTFTLASTLSVFLKPLTEDLGVSRGLFSLLRSSLVSVGDALLGSMVINVPIARWFVRRRGRPLALSSMGIGFGKVGMPVFA